MAAIRQSEYIDSKTVSIRKEKVDNRDMGALFMTQNVLVPFGNPISFEDYDSACLHFGSESDEAKVAKIYFGYTDKHTTKQTRISFGRYTLGSSTTSSLLVKDEAFTFRFTEGPVFDAKCKWVSEDGTEEEITGEEAVQRQYLRYAENGWIPQHEGEVMGFRSPYEQGHTTYFVIARTSDNSITRRKRTITLEYMGEVDSVNSLPAHETQGAFYSVRPASDIDRPELYAWWFTNRWVRLDPSHREGDVIDVVDLQGNPIYDVVKTEEAFSLLPLYRINAHTDRGTVATLAELLKMEGGFGETYSVKDRFGCRYTSDGRKWYVCAHTDVEADKVVVSKLVGSRDVAPLADFYRNYTNNLQEHITIQQTMLNTISCTNLGTKVFLSDLPMLGVEQGNMYFVEEKGLYYVYDANGKWMPLDYYVKTFSLPITPIDDRGDSSGDSSTPEPFPEEEQDETGIGYYKTVSQVRIPTLFSKYMESYEDLAAALQKEIRLYSDFKSVSVRWIHEGADSSGGEIGHFEVVSEDSVGLSAIVYNPTDPSTDFGKRFGFETQEYVKSSEHPKETSLEAIQRLSKDYNDFGSFAFLDDAAAHEEIAKWNLAENYKFLYSFSSNTPPAFSCLGTAATLRSDYTGTHEEVIPMAIFAATHYEIADSVKNFMFQQFDAFAPSVFTEADKRANDKANVNYIGRTQEHGRFRDYFQRGVCLDGTSLSVYCAEVWLQDRFTTVLLDLLVRYEKIKPNIDGLELISAVMTPQIQKGLANGMIQVPASLDDATKVYIDQITGADGSWKEVLKDGFALVLNVEDDAAHGGKCFTYTLVYHKAGVIRKVDGLHAFREQ